MWYYETWRRHTEEREYGFIDSGKETFFKNGMVLFRGIIADLCGAVDTCAGG